MTMHSHTPATLRPSGALARPSGDVVGRRSRAGIALDLALADAILRARAARTAGEDAGLSWTPAPGVRAAIAEAPQAAGKAARSPEAAEPAPQAGRAVPSGPRAISGPLAVAPGRRIVLHLSGGRIVGGQMPGPAPTPDAGERGAHVPAPTVPARATHASVEAEVRADMRARDVDARLRLRMGGTWVAREGGT